jgi:hypothetical protein
MRVGVVVPSTTPAAWIAEAVALLAATGAHVSVRVIPSLAPSRPSGWSRLILAVGGTHAEADPDAPRPLCAATSVDAHEPEDVDVVFFVGGAAQEDISPWPTRLGTYELTIDPPLAGLRETLDDAGAVAVALRRVDGEGVLRPSWSRVQRLSPATTRARALWRAATLPARALGDLAAGRVAVVSAGQDPVAPLSRWTALYGGTRLAGRAAVTGVRKLLSRNEWFVACSIDDDGPLPDLERMTPLVSPRDRFWADPFPVIDGDRACIFVEEWLYALGRGVLAALEIERDGSWRRLGTVLELPWHLSHPFLFRWQGDTWMLPESSAGGTLELYRCVDYPLRWERECVVMQDLCIVDATLHEGEDRWWLFANIGADQVSTHEELHLFYADTPLGPWTPHPANPVICDPRSARPAGRLFEWDGRLCRPAQDCGVRYGRALVIHEVLELTPDRYAERPRTRLQPQALAGANRMHTLNRDGWLTVVDGHRDRWRLT